MNLTETTPEQHALQLELARVLGYDEAKQKLSKAREVQITLTNEQCNEFRRSPHAFNEMVRDIFKAGYDAAKEVL